MNNLSTLSHSLVQKASALGVIDNDKLEIYEYGVEDFLYTLFTWCVFLLAGMLMGMFWYMLLFMLAYTPLRMYAGGIHCKTRGRCFIASGLITAVVFLPPYFVDAMLLAKIVIFALLPCIVTIKLLAPVEDMRKPLNAREKKRYLRISLTLCLILAVCCLLCAILTLYATAYFIGAALMSISVQLVLGKIKNSLLMYI